MSAISILGAGMAGFGAAYRLYSEGISSVMYEKNSYHGGHAASFQINGFIFDDGPHISFTKNERIQKLLAENVDQQYEFVQARSNNYWKGYWIKHPAQCNLYGLPHKTVVDILHDFIVAQTKITGKLKNYKEWLYASFGKTFAEMFPMQYGKKFHTTTAENMTTEWIGVRLYKADLREVLNGALSSDTPDVHYVNHFRYPAQGGFVSYLNSFLDKTNLHLNQEMVEINPKERTLSFASGLVTNYDYVISSVPLPELIPRISEVPTDVLEASKKLACTTCVLVNIGVNRDDISKAHWTYFYDEDFVFTRLSFPHMQSINNAPTGAGSIQAEIYYSDKYRPLNRNPESLIIPVVKDLKRCGIIQDSDKILFKDARLIPYANVIFDLERQDALSKIHGYLDDIGISYCGRYGEWGYHWTDESFLSGEKAAQKVIDIL
jgi:protoporphyrinogen oxidase